MMAAVNTERYSLLRVGIFSVYTLYVREGRRHTPFIKRLVFSLFCDFQLFSYKRI